MSEASYKRRLDHIFERTAEETAQKVAEVLSRAIQLQALGSDRVAIEIRKAIETAAETAVEDSLASYDRVVWPMRKLYLLDSLRAKIRSNINNKVRDLGRNSPAFGPNRDQLLDQQIMEAEKRLLSLVDQFATGLTAHKPASLAERHKTAFQAVNWILTVAALVIAILAYAKRP